MIHRALLGSFERFIGILIEHFGGELPLWLTPVQAIVLPVSDRHHEYARDVVGQLRAHGIRAELDDRGESVGRQIRDAELRKIPYMLVVGDREQEAGEVGVREHRARRRRLGPDRRLRRARHDRRKSRRLSRCPPLYSVVLIQANYSTRPGAA